MASYTEQDLAKTYSVECPSCGMMPNNLCVSKFGRELDEDDPHVVRLDAGRIAAMRKVD